MKIGERVLLSRVRSAERDTLILTDGFSCREQIMHGTPRHALHLAEAIQMAFHQPPDARKRKYAESGFVQETPSYAPLTATLGAGLVLASAWLLARKAGKDQATDAQDRA
jgi:hypothetical protein